MSTVTSKGQVTLPKKIRDELGLVPGSEVEFEVGEGQVVLRKKVSQEKLARWQGYLCGKLQASPLRPVEGETARKGAVDKFLDELRGERPAEIEHS